MKLLSSYKPSKQQQQYLVIGLLSGNTRVSRCQKSKTNLDFTEPRTVSGSGISWAIYKSAPHPRQIITPAPHHSVFLQAGCPSCHPTNNVKVGRTIIKNMNKKNVTTYLLSHICRSLPLANRFSCFQFHFLASTNRQLYISFVCVFCTRKCRAKLNRTCTSATTDVRRLTAFEMSIVSM